MLFLSLEKKFFLSLFGLFHLTQWLVPSTLVQIIVFHSV
jgi:hypothetical protein